MYYLFVLGKALSLLFPRGVGYLAAKLLAAAQYCFSAKDRETVLYNLAPIIRDEKKRKEIARSVFVNFAYYLVDFFRYSKLDDKFIKKYVKVSGEDYLNGCFSRRQGIIIISAHLGNYELGGAVTSLLKQSTYAIALPHKNKHINDFFNRQRRRVNMKVIPTGMAIKQCFSLLKQGEMIAFLGDRNFIGGGVEVEMFSRQAKIPRGAFFFALKTGACIIPSFFIRENKYFYHLIFEKPIFGAPDLSGADSLGENTGYVSPAGTPEQEKVLMNKYLQVLEKYIQKYPDQWYMFGKYWQ